MCFRYMLWKLTYIFCLRKDHVICKYTLTVPKSFSATDIMVISVNDTSYLYVFLCACSTNSSSLSFTCATGKLIQDVTICHRSIHYNDVIMTMITSQITSLTVVYSTVYADADKRKHQSSASLALVWGIHRGPVNSPHKGPVTRKMFPFDDVIMFIVEYMASLFIRR